VVGEEYAIGVSSLTNPKSKDKICEVNDEGKHFFSEINMAAAFIAHKE
jgi:hypothetical protein